MCHNHSTTPPPSDLTPPRRKNRSKTRKPKYLSLRLQLNPSRHKPAGVSDSDLMTHGHQQQLNLFPLHPENLVDDKDMMQDDHNVAFLFTSHAPASLNGLLRHDSTTTTTTTTEEEEEECVRRDEENGRSLLRKAMKRGSKEEEGDGREERWVCYSEVTSYSSGNTTESTATTTTTTTKTTTFGLLSLKLDYEGVLNAWSDQRSLYVPGETPLAVPHHVLPHHFPNVQVQEQDSVSGKEEEEEGEGEGGGKREREREKKMGEREASVLRYKQKRESRLFSKRIRYEVRKLNAEKRPRMKGRFVKRD